MNQEKISKRTGSIIKLKPEYEERYIILHKYAFPGVLERIRKSNIRNYSIFLHEGILFSYYEYVGKNFDEDMKEIADPVTKDWWKLTDPMQEPVPTRKEGEWWAEMDQILNSDKLLKPSSNAQRIALTAQIKSGFEDQVRKLFAEFPEELKDITHKENFQNNNVYLKDGRLYFYYEYTGNDLRGSFNHLNQSEAFRNFQNELTNYLEPNGNSSWSVMQEVFYTN